MGRVAGVIGDPPGFPYTPPGVDVLEGGKLATFYHSTFIYLVKSSTNFIGLLSCRGHMPDNNDNSHDDQLPGTSFHFKTGLKTNLAAVHRPSTLTVCLCIW